MPPLEVFTTELSAARATVYVRLRGRAPDEGWSLAGEVRGPRCVTSQMLSARYELRDLGPGPTTLAGTVLLDPVGWSAALPAVYDVRVEVRQHGVRVEELATTLAIRWLDVRGDGIYRENRRVILRGIERAALESFDPAALRIGDLAVLRPRDEEGTAATDYGLLSIADGAATSAAVGIVVLPPDEFTAERLRAFPPNLLFACEADEPAVVPDSAQLVLANVDEAAAFAARWKNFTRPILAVRPTSVLPAAEVRAACDAFRRDLAPFGQFAGYLLRGDRDLGS